MQKYRLLGKKGEGTFSEVLKAQCIRNDKFVAIKCMKTHYASVDQVNRVREIQALRRLSPHPNVIKLYEVLYDRSTGRLALVFELMDMNVYELIRERRAYLPSGQVLDYMYQLVKGIEHMHRNGIFHRDIKPENVLLHGETLKLADFGSCRGIYATQPFTEYISTRWYRAPECLLTDGYYNFKMDVWGVGCVFFEILALYPLFPGANEMDQIEKIHEVLGTPNQSVLDAFRACSAEAHIDFDFPPQTGSGLERKIPHAPRTAVDLVTKMLTYSPEERITAKAALKHPYFDEPRRADAKLRRERRAAAAIAQVPAKMLNSPADSPDGEEASMEDPPEDEDAGTTRLPPIAGAGNTTTTTTTSVAPAPTQASLTHGDASSTMSSTLPSLSRHSRLTAVQGA